VRSTRRTLPRRCAMTLALAALFVPLALHAAPFDGTYVNSDGERIVLSQRGATVSGSVAAGGMRMSLSGTVRGGALRGKVRAPTGDSLPFVAQVGPQGLVVTMDGERSLYRRQGGAAVAPAPGKAPPGRAPHRPGPTPAPAAPTAPPPAGPAASGSTYRSEYEGWGLRVPRGWKLGKREDSLVIASNTEAGMIIVEATSVTDTAALGRALSSSLAELGTFPQVPTPQKMSLPAGRGVHSEVRGKAKDGTPLWVRAVGVIGKQGTVTLVGITTTDPQKLGVLRKRVDAVAKAVFFFKPKVSPARNIIAGEWYSYSGGSTLSGGGGSESVLSFCPNGTYLSSYESGYSGSGWGSAGQSGGAGRWRVEGGASRGNVLVTRRNGSSFRIPYRVQSRSVVYFNGRKHARMGRKRCR